MAHVYLAHASAILSSNTFHDSSHRSSVQTTKQNRPNVSGKASFNPKPSPHHNHLPDTPILPALLLPRSFLFLFFFFFLSGFIRFRTQPNAMIALNKIKTYPGPSCLEADQATFRKTSRTPSSFSPVKLDFFLPPQYHAECIYTQTIPLAAP